jgi:glycosyltransferase involved in cell wall biosynthesis
MTERVKKNLKKRKVAICHVRLGWGGSEKRVWWGIEALKDEYDVSIITAGEFDLKAINNYYATSLREIDFSVRQTPLPFFLSRNAKAAALRAALYQRFCRKIAHEFDVLISAYGPCDFGVPAIHFIADFSWDTKLREELHPRAPGLIYQDNILRTYYLWMARMFYSPSGRNLFSGEDWIIAVSPWVAGIMREKYGIECRVIYSPVHGNYYLAPVQDREEGFVCLGRIAQEKRIEQIIEILYRVRSLGHKIHLHIIGGKEHDAYGRKIETLCQQHADWVTQEGRLIGEEKVMLLSKHRYGIHGCHGDAFPGAVIEMMKAGCLVWVHDSGGQADIVNHPALLYANIDDAVGKIDKVLKNTELQNALREFEVYQIRQFSTETFARDIKLLVGAWLKEHGKY